MESIEMTVYIVATIVIAAMVLVMTGKLANDDAYDSMRDTALDKEAPKFEKVNNETLVPYLYDIWRWCGLGKNEYTVTFNYVGDNMDMHTLFRYVKKEKICDEFSSFDNGCGKTEDVALETGSIAPGVRTAKCVPYRNQLVIT